MSLSNKRRYEILKRDGFTCQYCGRKPPVDELVIDHIQPKSKGGDNNPGNLLTACQKCNSGKGTTNVIGDNKECRCTERRPGCDGTSKAEWLMCMDCFYSHRNEVYTIGENSGKYDLAYEIMSVLVSAIAPKCDKDNYDDIDHILDQVREKIRKDRKQLPSKDNENG
jgi:hypothetical protein